MQIEGCTFNLRATTIRQDHASPRTISARVIVSSRSSGLIFALAPSRIPLGFSRTMPLRSSSTRFSTPPQLLHFVKERGFDSDRRPGRWLLTGSQSFRVDAWGSARPWRGAHRSLWFAGYVQTYLERDVRDLLRVGDLAAFNRFVALVAARTGSILNLSELGRDAGVSAPTVRQWLSVLEASELVYLLKPYFKNFGKRIVKSPKLYSSTPGSSHPCSGSTPRRRSCVGQASERCSRPQSYPSGRRRFAIAAERSDLYYWKSSCGEEVDLVFERNGRLHGIGVKATATPVPRHGAALEHWLALAGRNARAVLACRNQ